MQWSLGLHSDQIDLHRVQRSSGGEGMRRWVDRCPWFPGFDVLTYITCHPSVKKYYSHMGAPRYHKQM